MSKTRRTEMLVPETVDAEEKEVQKFDIPEECKDSAVAAAVSIANTLCESIKDNPPLICRRVAVSYGLIDPATKKEVVPASKIAELAAVVVQQRGHKNLTIDEVDVSALPVADKQAGPDPDRDVILTYWTPVDHAGCRVKAAKRAAKVCQMLLPPSAVFKMDVKIFGDDSKEPPLPAAVITEYMLQDLDMMTPDGVTFKHRSVPGKDDHGTSFVVVSLEREVQNPALMVEPDSDTEDLAKRPPTPRPSVDSGDSSAQ